MAAIQDRPIKNTLGVICDICGAKAGASESKLDYWKYDFANRNTVCPACLPLYESRWPAPKWSGPEVKIFNGGAKFTRKAFARVAGDGDQNHIEKSLIRFMKDNGVKPIGNGSHIVIHPGREIYVYYH